jgi:plasmid stabilization system protein ParE
MNYTVIWTPAAEQHLAAVWLAATDRKAVNSAATEIDRLLANEPGTCGYPRPDGLRTLAAPPLAVHFEVFPQQRTVNVIALWALHIGGNGAV